MTVVLQRISAHREGGYIYMYIEIKPAPKLDCLVASLSQSLLMIVPLQRSFSGSYLLANG